MLLGRQPVELELDDLGPSDRTTPFWKRRKIQILGVVLFIILAFIFTRGKAPVKPDDRTASKDGTLSVVTAYTPLPDPPPVPKPVVTTSPPPPPPPPPAPKPVTPPPTAAVPPPPPAPSIRSQMPVMGNRQSQEPPKRPVMLSFAVLPPVKPTEVKPSPETDIDFKTSTIPGTQASAAIDDTYMLLPGLLPMVLDSAVQSDLPGPLYAHLAGNVYSPKGVLLMEAGTRIVGRYETMKNNSGNRLMAAGMMAYTPNGVWVPLTDQPMSDDLGRTGLDGEVNNHFMQRFGGALLLTVGESATSVLQSMVSQGGNTYLQLNSGGGGGSTTGLAQQILQAQINIPPTFTKHQGETMALSLTTPVSFRKSYKLEATK